MREYAERFYVPSIRLSHEMMDEDLTGATKLATWKQRVREAWPLVEIKELTTSSPSELQVGEAMRVEASVQLGPLTPSDVAVELYHGPTAGGHELLRGAVVRMRLAGNGLAPGVYRFTGEIADEGQRRTCLRGSRDAVECFDEPPLRDIARSLGLSSSSWLTAPSRGRAAGSRLGRRRAAGSEDVERARRRPGRSCGEDIAVTPARRRPNLPDALRENVAPPGGEDGARGSTPPPARSSEGSSR